jgi:hypothetical protein
VRYRAKPVEIEALRFDGTNFGQALKLLGASVEIVDVEHYQHYVIHLGNQQMINVCDVEWYDDKITSFKVLTANNNWAIVTIGDYLIPEPLIQGRGYPCDPATFETRWEPIEEEK